MPSRTMKLSHRGTAITVREGSGGRVELVTRYGKTLPSTSKTFEAATNEARKWLLDNAGKLDLDDYPKLSR